MISPGKVVGDDVDVGRMAAVVLEQLSRHGTQGPTSLLGLRWSSCVCRGINPDKALNPVGDSVSSEDFLLL